MTKDVKELSIDELGAILEADFGSPKYHARQIYTWIYRKSARDFSVMTDLPEELRERLAHKFYVFGSKLSKTALSDDGTEKLLLELKDGNFIEAVSIPVEGRITGCVSTQVGCKYSCKFCASGILGLKRNLTCAEMLEELLLLNKDPYQKRIGNVVIMGTGEPFDNYDNLLKFIRMIRLEETFGIGARRITVSTCGIIPGIKRLSDEGMQIELSVSLHAADEGTRTRIMPVNSKYPLSQLIPACKEYAHKTDRQVTFEYLLVKGLNSGLQDAQKLAKLLHGFRLAKVNIIPANPVKELKIEPPSEKDILLFKDTLIKNEVNATLRKPRGRDIEAACGQLRLRHAKK